MSDPLEVIRRIFEKNPDLNCRISPSAIRLESRYRDDLRMDSLGMMSFLFELQDQFPHLEEKDLLGWKTIADTLKSMAGT